MNKKSKQDQDKKLSIYKLIDDYTNSIRKYQQSLSSEDYFDEKQVEQQRGFLKILYQKLQKYSKDKASKKYFSQLKHIQFVLTQLKQSKNQIKQQSYYSSNDSISIELKKQAMIIQQQNQQIQRLTRYSSTSSLLDQTQKSKSPHIFTQSQIFSKRVLPQQYEQEIEDMRDSMTVIRKENRELKDTNKMLLSRLNETNNKLNILLSRCGTLQNSNIYDDKILLSMKKQTIDTDRSLDFQAQIIQKQTKYSSEYQDKLIIMKIQNDNLQRKIQQLTQQLSLSQKQCNQFKQKYLRVKHNITRNDSSDDILKNKGGFLKKQQSIDKMKKIQMLNNLKGLVADHRKSIPKRNQQFN